MLVVNVNSGLGNQMFHYALFLRLAYENPDEKVLFDDSIFSISEKQSKYEVERIFNMSIPKVSDTLSSQTYEKFIEDSKNIMHHLPHNWLSKGALLCSADMCEHLSNISNGKWTRYTDLVSLYQRNMIYDVGLWIKRLPLIADVFYALKPQEKNYNMREFYTAVSKAKNIDNTKLSEHEYILNLLKVPAGENRYYIGNFEAGSLYFSPISEQVRKVFRFPELDERNLLYASVIESTESISVHLRRGDHLQSNDVFFTSGGYYYRAVHQIKRLINSPTFFIFSDDIEWCRENLLSLGFEKHDKIVFVEGNSGLESYKDMQLMSICTHNIIPISTFSWWASFLNSNPNKIVIAPQGYWADATIYL